MPPLSFFANAHDQMDEQMQFEQYLSHHFGHWPHGLRGIIHPSRRNARPSEFPQDLVEDDDGYLGIEVINVPSQSQNPGDGEHPDDSSWTTASPLSQSSQSQSRSVSSSI